MMITYPRNSQIVLFTNYVDANRSPILNGISGNTLDVYHFNSSGNKIFDVTTGVMTQDSGAANRFFYLYDVSGTSAITNYLVEYTALQGGNEVQTVESFGVSPAFSTGFPLNSHLTLFTNYVSPAGAPVLAGVSGSTVSVYHYSSSGTKVFDTTSGTMTQDGSDLNRFYYQFDITGTAAQTNYVAEYNSMFSGNAVQSTDVFDVSDLTFGSALASGTVTNSAISGINGALVNVSPFPNTNVIQSTTTVSGNYFLMLNPGDYVLSISASGYISTNVFRTVPSSMPTFNFGNTILFGFNEGTIQISDTYVHVVDDNAQIPLSGLRVSLFNKGAKALNVSQAIAIGYTNVSGTFTLNANPGRYVLLVEGTQPDNAVYQTSYDIDVDPMFANASSTGFRYLGTSQYNFLI